MSAPGIDDAKVQELKAREDARFTDLHPRSIETWRLAEHVMPNGVPMSWLRTSYDHPPIWVDDAKGSRFRDVDGHEYADFNIADMSMFTGYGPDPVVEAVSRRMAAGSQFLLPNEDSIWVATELGRRYGLPQWQFTLSATHANLEVLRIARVRDRTREGALLPRQVPRPLRRGARGAAGHGAGRRGSRAAARRRPQRRHGGVQRRRGTASCARDARDRDRHDRAGAHEQRGAARARSRLPRGAAGCDPRDRHAALPTTRPTRTSSAPGASPQRGSSSPTSSRPGSRSRAACRSAPTA